MKYLFFFNGQLLLLCCICCKIAIQDFVTRLHKKIKKNLRFHRRTKTRWYFTESWKNIMGLCHFHRWTKTRRYFTERCKKFMGLCHNHRRTIELQTIYGIVPQSPTAFRHKIPMESPTELHTSRSARMSDTCPSAQIPTNRKVWRDFQNFLVHISINFRRYYRRNLMPPTTINVRR